VSGIAASAAAEQALRADARTLSAAQDLTLDDALREIRALLARAAGVDQIALLAHPEQLSAAHGSRPYLELLARRLRGEPMAYLFGEREFYGRSFEVNPDVLIPRPETETLVDLALELVPERSESRVLDLGTGSGCIAVTLAKQRREIKVLAIDASKAALAVAARNVARHAAFNVELRAGNWFGPVEYLTFDMIVSNPPYIADNDPHLTRGDLRYEPRAALCGGTDGLRALEGIVIGAPGYLRSGGWLLVEHGYEQADAVAALMRAHGFAEVIARNDLAGIARVAAGHLLEDKAPSR
jgi:release factor glutamine methyltransferase